MDQEVIETENVSQSEPNPTSIYDSGFKAGYNAAVLAAAEWLKEHPYAFTLPNGEKNFLKAMDEGI